ncbi:uncharacterized protein FA14DRAFT_191714 [Meira miltonrushii]|uniref:Uncharacterized protein n=1 Tax=Meira miltonrushii TaxID=1280837 RepID=A0A316V505_9BASI|nr:uncharacterized protein FA14DRAFT_191714 [Meira miltonrushii]PWN32626.1 hypothetical protein FA14DRAFT_191714 [Meira miltonrushii]
MSHRYGVRANIENEQRRLQREPVAVWKKEWVIPPIAAGAQNNVKVLKWVRTSDTIRFDPEEEHMVGEETMANMEVDPAPAPIETLPVLPSVDVLPGDSQTTSDALPVTSATPADTNAASVEQTNDESMDITMDQSINPTEEQAQPAAAANPDTAAIHDSVAIVETGVPEQTATSTPTQITEKESSSIPPSQPVSMTTELESTQPLTQASLPIPAETQEGEEGGQNVQSIGSIAETSILPPSTE